MASYMPQKFLEQTILVKFNWKSTYYKAMHTQAQLGLLFWRERVNCKQSKKIIVFCFLLKSMKVK